MKRFWSYIIIIFFIVVLPLSAQNKIYWTDDSSRKIQRSNLDGSSVEDLVSVSNAPVGIDVDIAHGKIYWTSTDGVIHAANLDGSSAQDLVTGLTTPVDVAVDAVNGKIYWTDRSADKIQRANLDGSGVEDLITGINGASGIDLDVAGGKMYWAEQDDNKIQRANFDGSGIEDLVTGLSDPYGLALDLTNNKIYFSDFGTGKIQRCNLDGSSLEDVLTGLGYDVDHLDLDVGSSTIYFATYNNKISKVGFDGTGHADVVTGLNETTGLALYFPEAEMNLKQGTTDIADGASYDFGSRLIGTDTDVVFTIENTGSVNLTLSGSPVITITGADAGQFSVQGQPTSPVTPSGNTTFTIRFTPTSPGAKTASISIGNSDSNENPYDLTLTGTGQTVLASVTTQAATGITTTSATGNGNITSLGVPNPTGHGMVWNTGGTPTLADSSSDEGVATATGAFTSAMTGLSAYTTYYVRAYATNLAGTTYGNQVSFTTQGITPAVTTQAMTGIGTNSATGNGNITTLGIPNPTAHGMVWNTIGNPTLADSSSNEGAAAATGAFTSNLAGLSPGITYYVKAYATNAVGTAYGNEVSFTSATQLPTVTTQAVSGIGTTTATGNGNITSLGAPNPTGHGMVWNTTGNPTLADNSSNEGAIAATGAFTSNLTGISPGVTYYVKAYATNLAGTAYGSEVTFTTLGSAPAVTTQPVNRIGVTTATGNGTITTLGLPDPTAHGMVWNTTGNPTLGDNFSDEGPATATGPFTSNMTGLSPNTTYYFKAYVTNAVATAYGVEFTFSTRSTPPAVTTLPVTGIGTTSATGNGNITSLGAPNPTAHGMVWSTRENPTLGDNFSDEGPATATGPFTSNMTGLSAGVTYYVRAYVANTAGSVYGDQVIFTTLTQLPGVTTQAVTEIAAASATGNGNITGLGAPNPTAHGMVWNTAGNPTLADNFTDEGAAATTGAFTSNMTGLSSNTTYYVKAYATNAAGTIYGNEVSYKTNLPFPIASTQPVTDITETSARGNGTITDLGVPNPTAHGMVWNDTGVPPTLADSFTDEGAVSATGAFTSIMAGLNPNTIYYVRAYATNTVGTSYGNKVIFTTSGGLPKVTTLAATGITDTTALSGGKVNDDGGSAVTARGVCWSISSRPTIRDEHTVDGSGTGRFTSYLTGLTPDTTYYYRAYATNSFGTAYGREKSFTTKGQPEPPTVEIIDPEEGANVSGVVTIKAKAASEQGIKNVEFFVDGDKIGEGTLARADNNALRFDLTGAAALFIDRHNTLKKRDSRGNTASVLNYNIKTEYICSGPDGCLYILFKSLQRLSYGNDHLLVKVNPRDGMVRGIDPHISSLCTGFKTSPAIQFDGAGDLYCFTSQDGGRLSLRRYVDKANNRVLFAAENMEIAEWLVRKNGTVILAGKTKTDGSRWMKVAAANQSPIHLTNLFNDIEWMSDSSDGYAYAETAASVYRISDRRVLEIAPDSLPADVREKEREMEISLEAHGFPGTGNTYSIDWDTSSYDFGRHTIKAVAYDNIDQTCEDAVSVNIPEIILTLTASKETEKAWIINRLYGKLDILVENLSDIPVSKYIIYRKAADGEFKAIITFTDADLIGGAFSYNDKYLESDKTYTYKVEAADAVERVIAQSAEVSI